MLFLVENDVELVISNSKTHTLTDMSGSRRNIQKELRSFEPSLVSKNIKC